MAVQIQMRRDVAADWTSANPVLAEGELGLETDTAKWKIGDGATAWTSLGYANQVVAGPASVSNSGASPALTITNTGSGYSLLVEDSASTDSTPFVVTAAGDVGIGTASPAVKLDVVGVVAVPLGSAALPSITPTGDPNTGIWSPAADTLAVSTGGTERMRIDSAGNVGIGVTPATLFHTESDTASNDTRLAINNTSANPATIRFTKRRGTAASKTVVANADQLGAIYFSGYDGAADQFGAAIIAGVDATPGAGDMPGRLLFYTTADGGTSLTERMRIDNAGLITGTGTSLGAWTAYTPTWTNITVGDATQDFQYCRIGKTVHFHGRITLGGTSAVTGPVDMTLPVAQQTGTYGAIAHIGKLLVLDASASTYYVGTMVCISAGTVRLQTLNVAGTYPSITNVNATVPMAYATSDFYEVSGTYEIA